MIKIMSIQKKINVIVTALFIWYLTITSFGFTKDLIVSWSPNSEPDLAGYKVYWGTASRNYTDVVDTKNITNYTVAGLSEGIEYFFAVTAYDTASNESDFSEEVSFTIAVEDILPPEIQLVTLKNATELDLTFNEEVEQNSTEDVSNYQINNGISVIAAILDSDQKTVHLKTSQHSAGSYTITVNNIKDLAPNPNTIAPNSKANYQFIPDDTTPPTLSQVQILDATHVDVTFSEAIEKNSGESIQNFQINNNITIYFAGLDQNNRTVHLVTSAHQSGSTYTLVVNNIRDRATQPNTIATNTTKQYSYHEEDKTPPTIYSVNIRNYNLVDVTFSETVDQTSAQDPKNYAINNGVNVLVAILDINLKTVHLSTSTHQANITHTLTINNIIDRANPANKIATNSHYDYIYQPDDNIPPQLIRAEAMSGTSVAVTFSEALDRISAEQESNYLINEGISIIQASLDQDQKTVHLTTSAHESGKSYTLAVNNISDLAPNPNKIAPNSKINYVYIYQDKEAPRITSVQIVFATYLRINFSEVIEKGTAENIANYSISGGVTVLSAILDNNLNLVHLTTSEHQIGAKYTLTVNNIRDRAPIPNTIAPNTTVRYTFDVGSGSLVVGLNKDNYKLAYLKVGDKYYIDRNYTITSIPQEMNGYLWIMTANDDRAKTDDNFLSFQISDTARIYVAYDSRALNIPNWLANNFHRIGKSIGVTEYAAQLDLWEMDSMPGVITLGGNLATGAQGVESMYVVLIENNDPGSPDDDEDPISLDDEDIVLLYQNNPNPFNAGTEIQFLLPQNVYVELSIYNMMGQTVRTLTQGYRNAGHHVLHWDGKNEAGLSLPSGVYFSRLIIRQLEKTGENERYPIILNTVRKMIMIK
ncbi:Ig-like domain-containing protein [candidate division KSB1 bacterium]|nr:Ig-like domain-containing protein [candidate division KSB1 bacterium]